MGSASFLFFFFFLPSAWQRQCRHRLFSLYNHRKSRKILFPRALVERMQDGINPNETPWISQWRSIKTNTTYFTSSHGYEEKKLRNWDTEGHCHLSVPSFSDAQGLWLSDHRSEYIPRGSCLTAMKRSLPSLTLGFRPLGCLYFKWVTSKFCWVTFCFQTVVCDEEGKRHCFPTEQHESQNWFGGNEKSPGPLLRNCSLWDKAQFGQLFCFLLIISLQFLVLAESGKEILNH